MTRLDRFARLVPDARDIAGEVTACEVKLSVGGNLTAPVGRLLFNVLALLAEFEADLARARTREGMAVARSKGQLRGKSPKLKPRQEAHLVDLHWSGGRAVSELEELFAVGRSTVYRAVRRASAGR